MVFTLQSRVVYGSHNKQTFSLRNINWLAFITDVECLLRCTN